MCGLGWREAVLSEGPNWGALNAPRKPAARRTQHA
jgi:hypothetical protein